MPKLPKEVNTKMVLITLKKNYHGVKEKVPQCGGRLLANILSFERQGLI
jgi:hypothetical protein